MFNLEVPGYRYTRISNPTTDVLEQRVTELEGGVGALSVASGQTALYYASMNALEMGRNIVSVPQLYGTTYTLFAHILPKMGIKVRFAKSDRAADIEALIDENTRAIFCETVGNPAGNVCDLEALADGRASSSHAADRRQHGGDADAGAAGRIRRRHRRALVDEIHGRSRHHARRHHRRLRHASPGPSTRHRYPMFTQPDESYHGLVYTEHYGTAAFIGRCRSVYQRTMGAVLSPMNAFLLLAGHRNRGAAHRASRRERAQGR